MKRLSDYVGEDAFELWADLMEPIVRILQDKDIIDMLRTKASKFKLATTILRNHKEEAAEILDRIDPEHPVNGFTIIVRAMQFLDELGSDPTILSFFGYRESATKE